ncbi:MAG: response regulator [Hyphomicrobiales bacterium]|nr:response regulator [Hyphomicrobiales bacterium]
MVKSRGIKVSIIEDEPAQMELLSYNLDKEGYRIFATSDGEEGLLIVKEELPELTILDWMLSYSPMFRVFGSAFFC